MSNYKRDEQIIKCPKNGGKNPKMVLKGANSLVDSLWSIKKRKTNERKNTPLTKKKCFR